MEIYLSEAIVEDDATFDILRWWKLNSERFHILLCMARDVLAVLISTVASESPFSTGGRVLDVFRSSLTPKIVEALICAQDWLRRPNQTVSVEETLDDLESFEKGYFYFLFSIFIISLLIYSLPKLNLMCLHCHQSNVHSLFFCDRSRTSGQWPFFAIVN